MNRRQYLARCANGFGLAALSGLLQDPAYGAADPFAPKPSNYPAKAKSVIFLYMDGGPSSMDTFDPKPRLDREHGRPIKAKVEPTQFNNNGTVLASPWKFKKHGQSGIPVSDLFPHVAQCVDDICFIHSMHTDIPEHAGAMLMMNLGHLQPSRPSRGMTCF